MSEDQLRPFNILKDSKRQIRKLTKAEEIAARRTGIRNEVWVQYGSSVLDYNSTFYESLSAFGFEDFRDFVEKRKAKGLLVNVLDLMGGDGSFLDDLKNFKRRYKPDISIDSGLSVTLADGREQYEKEKDRKSGIGVLSGDITSKSTWRKIEEWRRERGIDTFDLIVLRGGDGMDTIPEMLYPFLFNQIWTNLSNKDGFFTTTLKPDDEIHRIETDLSRIPGIRTFFRPKSNVDSRKFYPIVGVIKTEKAPEQLV